MSQTVQLPAVLFHQAQVGQLRAARLNPDPDLVRGLATLTDGTRSIEVMIESIETQGNAMTIRWS